jgi:membrane protein
MSDDSTRKESDQEGWRKQLKRAWKFLAEDVWDVEPTSLSGLRRFGLNAVRVVQLVFRGYRKDECPLHASALTFSTLMSIVPVLALSLAMASGLGGKEAAKQRIQMGVKKWTATFESPSDRQPGAHAVGTNVVDELEMPASSDGGTNATVYDGLDYADPATMADQINGMVEAGFEKIDNVNFGALSGFGLCLLLWMTLSVLGRVEASFNQVWGVSTDRSMWRKVTDYLSILFILPLLIVAASSLPVADYLTKFLEPSIAVKVQAILGSGFLEDVMVFLMTTVSFTFLIMFVPNTRVKLAPGLCGGIITTILFLLWLWLCARLQVGVGRAGRIYGSFAIVPIVLLWVHVSWQIVFFGAEVAFAVQNCATYRMEQGARHASVRSRILLALSLVIEAARNMTGKGGSLDVAQFARDRRVPVRFLNDVVDELSREGFLAELSEKPGAYVLLRAPESLPVKELFDCVLKSGVAPDELGLEGVPETIGQLVHEAGEGLSESASNKTIRDLLNE